MQYKLAAPEDSMHQHEQKSRTRHSGCTECIASGNSIQGRGQKGQEMVCGRIDWIESEVFDP
jgi:hypothetical protein